MNTIIKKFFATDSSNWAMLISRIALGIVILPHGMQKALGSFGGYGFEATVGFFQSMGIPVVIGVLVILAEFVGAIGLIVGAGTRFMAFSIFVTLGGAMVLGGHLQHGFFMNWFGNQAGEGIEYFILVLGMAAASMIAGAGKFSVDGLVSKYLK
jgi:putative oxidoreductase